MGNTACATCDCRSDREFKSSFITDIEAGFKRKDAVGTAPSASAPDYSRTQNSVVKIQTVWKGYSTRKEYLHLLKNRRRSRFFPREDQFETLRAARGNVKTRESRGVYTYRSGTVYQGQWRGGFRDGFGVQVWPGGSKYEGNWGYGWPCGVGKFTHSDGDMYEGAWKDLWVTGQASICISGPSAVSGFASGVHDGYLWLWYKEQIATSPRRQQTARLPKKAEIEAKIAKIKVMLKEPKKRLEEGLQPSAMFKANLRVFKRKEYEDGKVYEGEFADERRDGIGKATWKNGDYYEGEWRNDMHNGYGRNVFANGSSYCGSFKENMKHGLGEYKWEDGSSYVGEWQANKMQGVGEYVWPDGRRYLGEWANGVMHGFGILEWRIGKRYEGGWDQGKKHGEGISTTAQGTVSRDIWQHGKVVNK